MNESYSFNFECCVISSFRSAFGILYCEFGFQGLLKIILRSFAEKGIGYFIYF